MTTVKFIFYMIAAFCFGIAADELVHWIVELIKGHKDKKEKNNDTK